MKSDIYTSLFNTFLLKGIFRFIYIVAYVCSSFCTSQFLYFPIEVHVGCCQLLAIMNKAAKKHSYTSLFCEPMIFFVRARFLGLGLKLLNHSFRIMINLGSYGLKNYEWFYWKSKVSINILKRRVRRWATQGFTDHIKDLAFCRGMNFEQWCDMKWVMF